MKADIEASLCEALDVRPGMLVALVGAGGKTSLMYGLGRELAREGRPALLTTTTKIRFPERDQAGEVVLGEDGRIYEGCNVESRVSGLGVCAERNAIDHAVLHGNRKIKEVAVVVPAETHNAPTPCGACLQYIHDFARKPKVKIIIAKADKGKALLETVDVKTIGELLPFPYKKMNSFRLKV